MNKIAIIGTAGRDKTKPMTRALWDWMLKDAMTRIARNSHLVSGGAAWADHLAVSLFLSGHASALTLYLPAPFDLEGPQFYGPHSSSASAANYYHGLFSDAIGEDTLRQIAEAGQHANCNGECEPAAAGYSGMFARNKKVARDAECGVIAYTFGAGNTPADGGTKNTWDLCDTINKVHVSLPILN